MTESNEPKRYAVICVNGTFCARAYIRTDKTRRVGSMDVLNDTYCPKCSNYLKVLRAATRDDIDESGAWPPSGDQYIGDTGRPRKLDKQHIYGSGLLMLYTDDLDEYADHLEKNLRVLRTMHEECVKSGKLEKIKQNIQTGPDLYKHDDVEFELVPFGEYQERTIALLHRGDKFEIEAKELRKQLDERPKQEVEAISKWLQIQWLDDPDAEPTSMHDAGFIIGMRRAAQSIKKAIENMEYNSDGHDVTD